MKSIIFPFNSFCLLIVLWAICMPNVVRAAEKPDDLIKFFKLSITSPPDVDHFVVSQQTLLEPIMPAGYSVPTNFHDVQFYEGARSGSNYFVCGIPGPNLPTEHPGIRLFSVRAGAKIYQLSANAVSYTAAGDHNPEVDASEAHYRLVCQFLNMGLSDIIPESVVWKGDEFQGIRVGRQVYGHLMTSNGLPSSLEISFGKHDPPYKAFFYAYPTQNSSLAGYPSKITSCDKSEKGCVPSMEIELLSIHLAQKPLAEDFFSESRLLEGATNILHTNFYREGGLYAVQADGSLFAVPGHSVKSPQRAKPTAVQRFPTYTQIGVIGFAFVVLIALAIAYRSRNSTQ